MPDPYAAFWREDLGRRGDITTKFALADPNVTAQAKAIARHTMIASGVKHARELFRSRGVRMRTSVNDGDKLGRGDAIFSVRGPALGILEAERLVLNVVGRMSGIATLTRQLQDRVHAQNPDCRVAGTRKTTPGFRRFEKEAIEHGGGERHRDGLYDAVLIKDNHWALIDDLESAVRRLRKRVPGVWIEVEVTSLGKTRQAAEQHVDWILIDNQTPAKVRELAKVARSIHPSVRIEASGGITPANLGRYARYVDRISLGHITHSAPAADVSLKITTRP